MPSLMETAAGKWPRTAAAAALALATLSAAAAFSATVSWRRKCRLLASRVRELESHLIDSLEKGAAERRGRVRAQQALRKVLTQRSAGDSKPEASSPSSSSSSSFSYPMAPIATVRSCFSTRNGTPRQPLLVPLARACLLLDPARVPPSALEGLVEYSHCWVVYVFHLNTDLEKLWKHPSRSKFKAKVRVPRLRGGKMGVLATRSPHRPCPIGLTVAKVEAVDGHAVLLSGVDLVDGTPVLDIKPYLPYSDCIDGARTPTWIMKLSNSLAVASVEFSEDFASSLASCWEIVGKWSLYVSHDELQQLIKQVLSWDIRSLSQKNRPHNTALGENIRGSEPFQDMADESDEASAEHVKISTSLNEVIYHLVVEGIDITYRIDENSNIIVEKASLADVRNGSMHPLSCVRWRDKFA